MNEKLTVGLVQQSCSGDRAANIEKSIAGIRRAAAQGAELIVLQELHAGLYFCQIEDTGCFTGADHVDVDVVERIRELSQGVGKRCSAFDSLDDFTEDAFERFVFGVFFE